jgi:hypothetical protein
MLIYLIMQTSKFLSSNGHTYFDNLKIIFMTLNLNLVSDITWIILHTVLISSSVHIFIIFKTASCVLLSKDCMFTQHIYLHQDK